MDYSRPERADRLAAAYAAGVLRGGARARFEALLPSHPALRGALRQWQERLMPLTAVIPPQTPPARVWRRIEAVLFAKNTAAADVPLAWWRRLALWQGLSAAATMAALSLAVLLANPPAQTPLVVVLSSAGDGAKPAFVASFNADGRSVVTRPLVPVSVDVQRSLELWAVPASGAPRSLGLISARDASVVQRGRVGKDTAALAVTLEPAGGSPTGRATGPIVYVGKLTL